MRKVKKLIALLVIAGLVGSMAGCANKGNESGGGNASVEGAKDQDTDTGETQADDKDIELSVMVVFDAETEDPNKIDSFYKAAENLGYKVNVQSLDDETYKTKIRVMLQGNELPDLFYTWGGSYSTPFINAKALYPLETTLENSGYVLDDVYKQTGEDGHIYAVPGGALESYCLFYNKDVFEQLGKDVPTDWDELLDVVDACNEMGVGAIGLGEKDRWEGDLFYNMMVIREDADAFANAVNGNGSFTDEAFLKAAEKIQILLDRNAFQSGYMQATQPECVELLRAGKLAMYPTGSWQVSVFEKEENIGCAVFPKTGAEDPYLACCGNAADSGIAVAQNSQHVEEAAKLAVEYSKVLNDYRAQNGEQTYFQTDIEPGERSEMVQTYIENFDKMKKSQLWWYTYLDTAIGEPMRDLSHQQFAGEIDAESFVKELDQIIKGN